ncbi:MAG: TonB-dependent receptor [Ignavibacteriales bacterium]|nr:TonB-dependent receptor [Ignavibacteriales bacterium]
MPNYHRLWRQFTLLLFLVHCGIAGTVGIIDGRVLDKSTKEPLPAVSIQLIGTMMGCVTDIDGLYQLNNIPAGTYNVKFSYVGYKTITMKKVTVLADLRTRIEVLLEASTVQMQGVEVTAQKPLIQKDQPSTAYSIGEIKLERMPVTNFLDILSLQPGVTMEGNVRGGKTNEVLYLIDGMPVQDYISGGLGSELPKSAIGGITIMTGGFDAEYGNAMSAIVNVITRTGENEHRFNARFEKDNWIPSKWVKQTDQLNELELTASGPIVRNSLFYMTATTVRLSNTRWWQDMQNFFPSPSSKELSGVTKADYYATSTTRLSLQAIYTL